MRLVILFLTLATLTSAQPKPPAGFKLLFNGKNLDGWQVRGDGQWNVLSDGTLTGQRVWDRKLLAPGGKISTPKEFQDWLDQQAWLYTVADYGNYDLHAEFWTKTIGNSGISLRDPSRGEFGIQNPVDFKRTPSKLGYEIQINNRYPDVTTTGSVYTINKAPTEAMKVDDWNTFDIEVRTSTIRVKLNGVLVSDVACDPKRPVRGPIGLQLHDQFSIVQFRNLWIKEVK
jgi:Domain of Unknown Function (DUF1080)